MAKRTLRQISGKFTGVVFSALAAFSVAAALSAFPQTAGAAESAVERIKKAGKLVLATGNYRPFEYRDEKTNAIVGYDIDLAALIAKKIGVPLEAQDMQFQALIPSLQNGRVDIVIAAMYITPARREVVDFANPYMETGMVLVVRKDDTKVKGSKDLEGLTVGVKAGATSEHVAEGIQKEGVKFTIKPYRETVDYAMDLSNGRLDAAVNDLLNQLELNKVYPNLKIVGEPFTKAELGIAVRKGDDDLIKLVNTVLEEIKANGEGEKLYKKWIVGN
ncbi:MAG: transporter substrate-binding domain-containing protein [Candidatus Accumulibacter sp.]|nr:transporter substrate-binding domain-containing protein [Accumulibacter sp.]